MLTIFYSFFFSLLRILDKNPDKRPDTVDILFALKNVDRKRFSLMDDGDEEQELAEKLTVMPPVKEDLSLVKRKDLLMQIDDILFSENKYAVLQGVGGIGKTTLAAQFVHDLFKRKEKKKIIVIWFNAASRETIEEVYHSKLAPYFSLDRSAYSTQREFIVDVNLRLCNLCFDILIVYDNVQQYDDLSPFIDDLFNWYQFRVVLTTKDENLFRDRTNFTYLRLNLMNEEESVEYLTHSFSKQRLLNKSMAKEFYDYFSATSGEQQQQKRGVLPLVLKLAVCLFDENGYWQLNNEKYMSMAKSQAYLGCATNILLENFSRDSAPYQILLYLAYLDGSFVSFDLLLDLVNEIYELYLERNQHLNSVAKIQPDTLNRYLRELNKRALVEILHKENNYGVNVHDSIQMIIREKLRHESPDEPIANDLVTMLNRITPFVNNETNEERRIKMERAHLHVIKLVRMCAGKKSSLDLAQLLAKLALYSKYQLLDYQRCLDYALRAHAMFKKCYSHESVNMDLADSFYRLADAYSLLGDARKSLAHHQQSLDIKKKLFNTDVHPSVAASLNSIGSAHIALGDQKKALVFYQKSLDIKQQLYEHGNHPDIAASMGNIAIVYKTLGETSKALEYHHKSLDMYKSIYKGNHPDIASSLNNIGLAYKTSGEFKKALDYYQQSLKMERQLYSGNHPKIAIALNNIGLAYFSLGNAKKALDFFNQSLKMKQSLYGQSHPSIVISLNNIGSAYNALGESKKSIEFYNKASSMEQQINLGLF